MSRPTGQLALLCEGLRLQPLSMRVQELGVGIGKRGLELELLCTTANAGCGYNGAAGRNQRRTTA